MKVLFVSKYIPYSANSGITVKIYNLLSCMSTIFDVTCAYISEDNINSETIIDECDLDVKNILIYTPKERNSFKRYLKHLIDVLCVRKEIQKKLDLIITSEKPDAIWLEFSYICQFVPFLKRYGLPVYYGSHNAQFLIDWKIWLNSSIGSKIKLSFFLPLYYIHERLFFRLADKTLCISQQDLEYYKKFIPESKLDVVPYYLDQNKLGKIKGTSLPHKYICIVGTMGSTQNSSAVIYALEKIWPKIQSRNNKLYFYIIGRLPQKNTSEYKLLVKKVTQSKNVVLTGEVASVVPYVKSALVNIVPILFGSGVRTKIIESIACKTPVVSTSIGAEGLPFVNNESILIGDDADSFSENVCTLVEKEEKRRRMSRKAYNVFCEHLSVEAGKRKLEKLMLSEP